MQDKEGEIRWQISIPIFKNTIILKQLGFAKGIPFGLVAVFIGLASGCSIYTLYALGLITGLLILTWLLLTVVWGGMYKVEFALDHKGVFCRTQAKQVKKNRIINTLTVVVGLLSSKPATTGAGLLAQSRQEVFLKWNRVTKVKYKPKSHTILLWGGWTEQIGIFCTAENYCKVRDEIMLFTTHLKKKA